MGGIREGGCGIWSSRHGNLGKLHLGVGLGWVLPVCVTLDGAMQGLETTCGIAAMSRNSNELKIASGQDTTP